MKDKTAILQDGKPVTIAKEGSLGLLALGYVGLVEWRKARKTELEELKKGKKSQ